MENNSEGGEHTGTPSLEAPGKACLVRLENQVSSGDQIGGVPTLLSECCSEQAAEHHIQILIRNLDNSLNEGTAGNSSTEGLILPIQPESCLCKGDMITAGNCSRTADGRFA